MAGHDVEGVVLVASHGAALLDVAAGAAAPLHPEEQALASLLRTQSFESHPAASDPVLVAGATLLAARRSDAFTRFDGNLDGAGIDVTAMGVLSPTSIETYATCPRKWFFTHALQMQASRSEEHTSELQSLMRTSYA